VVDPFRQLDGTRTAFGDFPVSLKLAACGELTLVDVAAAVMVEQRIATDTSQHRDAFSRRIRIFRFGLDDVRCEAAIDLLRATAMDLRA